MRTTIRLLLPFLSLALAAGEPLALDAPITKVRLHPSEAWVTRVGRIHLPKEGDYRIRVDHLPDGLGLDDIRVQAKGPEGTSLGEIRVGSEPAKEMDGPEAKALRAKLEALNLRKATLESEERAAAEAGKLLNGYEDAFAKGGTQTLPGGSAVMDSSRQLEARFRELLAQADARAREKVQVEQDLAKGEAEWQKLQGKLGQDRAPSQVTLEVLAPEGGDLEIELATRTRQARWQPSYEARVLPSGQVEWVLYAGVRQASGEAWKGIQLELSNANPDQTPEPPRFRAASLLGWKAPTPMLPGDLRGVPSATVVVTARPASADATQTMACMVVSGPSTTGLSGYAPYAPPAPVRPVLEPGAQAISEAKGLFTVYRIEGAKDLPSDGDSHRFKVASASVEGRFLVTVAPRLAGEAFRVVRFPVPEGLPLFPNQPVTRLYAGQRLGQGPLALPAAGQPMELSLGSFQGLRAQFVELERSAPLQRSQVVLARKVEKGVVRQTVKEEVETSTGDARVWRLKERFILANDTPEPLEVEVQDRLLRSGHESVAVSVEDPRAHPSVVRPEASLRAWTLRLGPRATEDLEVGTTLRAPRDGEVQGLRELGLN